MRVFDSRVGTVHCYTLGTVSSNFVDLSWRSINRAKSGAVVAIIHVLHFTEIHVRYISWIQELDPQWAHFVHALLHAIDCDIYIYIYIISRK